MQAVSLEEVQQRLELRNAVSGASISYSYSNKNNVVIIDETDTDIFVLSDKIPKLDVLREIRRINNGKRIKVLISDHHTLQKAQSFLYENNSHAATEMADFINDEVDLAMLSQEIPETTDLLAAEDDAPVVKLINALLSQAVREGVSDIHLEVFEKDSVVRFRKDGVLKNILDLQRALHASLVSRLKVMAKLDIAEKRLPQDGRISIRLGKRPIDIRVSTLPTQHGERVVLRLLDKQSSVFDLEKLGMTPSLLKEFDSVIRQPHGIVLVTGPTGSGKTTTLYAGLSTLDRDKLNVLTVEDPVEYELEGVGQIQVHSKIGMTFAAGLRSILRQDPDVVLVGEIRDLETAQIAVQASLTGHLVLSTLHTNTAIGAITRLIDMGVEPFLISSSISAVLAQRLVRKLCNHCKKPRDARLDEIKTMELDEDKSYTFYDPMGCEECEGVGYRGRRGIYEFILIDDDLRTMIHDNASESKMLAVARKKSVSMSQFGYQRVLLGETSLDEVLRVTMD